MRGLPSFKPFHSASIGLATCVCALVFLASSHASPGSRDQSFFVGEGHVDRLVKTVAAQPDGKLLIGGVFSQVRGAARNKIARLNPDGTADHSFDPGAGADRDLNCIAVQPDGKILIGGQFTSFGDFPQTRVARLESSGSIDPTFNASVNGEVLTLALQPDGKVLLGGIFSRVNGADRPRLVRLHPNGALDNTFNPGSGPNSTVHTIAVQPDGAILIGGVFSMVHTNRRAYFARILTNGALDTNFNIGTGPNTAVWSIGVQEDSRIVLGGPFETFNGTPRNRLARLHADGSIDNTFVPGLGPDAPVTRLSLDQQGGIVIAGSFTAVRGIPRPGIARLKTDGTLDTSFDPGAGPGPSVQALASLPGGRIAVGGGFEEIGGEVRHRVAVLEADGSVVPTFLPGTGLNQPVVSLALQPDRKILVAGDFTAIGQSPRTRLARLNPDGSLDPSFDSGTGPNDWVHQAALQHDGKIWVVGTFGFVNGIWRSCIVRLNTDGSVDPSFNPGSGADFAITTIVPMLDGRVLIGGSFNVYNGPFRNRIARLLPDGKLDESFLPQGPDAIIHSMVLQDDGRIIVGGEFTFFNSPNVNRITRLRDDGSLDPEFNPPGGANDYVYALALQPDKRILVGGHFTTMNQTARNRIARLLPDGRLDATFNPGTGANGPVNSIAIQSDGRVIIAGAFTSYDGVRRNRIARLRPNGSLDPSFAADLDRDVIRILLQPDRKLLVSGAFSSVNSQPVPYLARLHTDPIPVALSILRTGQSISVNWGDPSFTLESATSLAGPFAPIANASPYLLTPTNQFQLFRLSYGTD